MLTIDQDFLEALGRTIAERRKALGLTQTDVADDLGCSQAMVASYESGRRRLPVTFLPTLAKTLHLTVGDLLGEEEQSATKRGPKSKFEIAVERASGLSRRDRDSVIDLIDALEARKNAKQKAS